MKVLLKISSILLPLVLVFCMFQAGRIYESRTLAAD